MSEYKIESLTKRVDGFDEIRLIQDHQNGSPERTMCFSIEEARKIRNDLSDALLKYETKSYVESYIKQHYTPKRT